MFQPKTNSGQRGVWVYEIGSSPIFVAITPGMVTALPEGDATEPSVTMLPRRPEKPQAGPEENDEFPTETPVEHRPVTAEYAEPVTEDYPDYPEYPESETPTYTEPERADPTYPEPSEPRHPDPSETTYPTFEPLQPTVPETTLPRYPERTETTYPVSEPLQPRYTVPENTEPRYSTVQPGYPDPEPIQPRYPDPEPVQPQYPDPEPVQPQYPDSEPTQPRYPDPEPVQPRYPDPEPVQPRYTDPEPTQPRYPDPEPVQPRYSDPEPVQPRYPDPEPIQPRYPDPEPVQPQYPDSEPIQPRYPDPEPVQPRYPDPEPVQPGPPRSRSQQPQIVVVDEDENLDVNVFAYNSETCALNRNKCSTFADCRDYSSGYCCHCRPGFYGNGKDCVAEGKPQRMNGKVSGRVFVGSSPSPVELGSNDLHSYVVANDGRAYVAISSIPDSLGPSLQPLSSLGGVIGWAFALEQPGYQNGFSLIVNPPFPSPVPGGVPEQNPCFTGRHGCDVNAACRPGDGLHFSCQCATGFTGDGRYCHVSKSRSKSKRGLTVDRADLVAHGVADQMVVLVEHHKDLVHAELLGGGRRAGHLGVRAALEADGLAPLVAPGLGAAAGGDLLVGADLDRGAQGDGGDPALQLGAHHHVVVFVDPFELLPDAQALVAGLEDDLGLPRKHADRVVIAVGYDCVDKMVYWTDITGPSISRASLTGGDIVPVITTDLQSPEGIAIDHVARLLFWTDSMRDTVEVSKLDGSQRRVLFDTDLINPRPIVTNPAYGRLYWADWDRDSLKIEMSNMDGTDRTVLVKDDLGLPNGLTFDLEDQQLCWADAGTRKVECMDPHRRLRRQIVAGIQYPFGLVAFGGKLYYTDWRREAVVAVDRHSEKETEEFLPQKRSRLYGITTTPSRCPQDDPVTRGDDPVTRGDDPVTRGDDPVSGEQKQHTNPHVVDLSTFSSL
ncbi:uncharacterized protein LOC117941512 [Etheostoma cragini]|uniref:uncharacterized protein LOC117941512 n=1 Tax=Etheostoma cragini TaxID=417921 RepID=UPI00155E6A64|nr:uncharacterized protein LOC117941512 [Etheostoma cragini]